jgi:hypothetical protein
MFTAIFTTTGMARYYNNQPAGVLTYQPHFFYLMQHTGAASKSFLISSGNKKQDCAPRYWQCKLKFPSLKIMTAFSQIIVLYYLSY